MNALVHSIGGSFECELYREGVRDDAVATVNRRCRRGELLAASLLLCPRDCASPKSSVAEEAVLELLAL